MDKSKSPKPAPFQIAEEKFVKEPSPKVEKVIIPESTISDVSAISAKLEGASLKEQFDTLMNSIDKIKGSEIASRLELIKNNVENERGYSGVLAPMNIAIASLKFEEYELNSIELEQLTNKINFWRKKLNV